MAEMGCQFVSSRFVLEVSGLEMEARRWKLLQNPVLFRAPIQQCLQNAVLFTGAVQWCQSCIYCSRKYIFRSVKINKEEFRTHTHIVSVTTGHSTYLSAFPGKSLPSSQDDALGEG